MSIHFSGTLTRSKGVVQAISKQLKLINLKGVKRVTISFDPFSENVKSTREFLFLLSSPKVALSNPKCVIKTNVLCNRQKPEVKFSLIDAVQEQLKAKEIKFISDNLSTIELLELCNKHISAIAPPEDTTTKVVTKAEKQKLAGSGKKIQKKK